MHSFHDGVRIQFLTRKNAHGSYFIDLLEYTEADNERARFMAIAHDGSKSRFDVEMVGQGISASAAIVACRMKARGFHMKDAEASMPV